MNDTVSGDRYVVPALQRGMQLLGQFSRNERELTGAELSRRLDLPRASVFRLLQTLEQMGFVERVGDTASYKLGRNWEVFGEVLNATNAPFRVHFAREAVRFAQFEEYGVSANFGVRWKL